MMLQSEISLHYKQWTLTGLENVFYFALEQKSKCLIQACIFIVEKEFSGVASFNHQTQVKFLLESIRHIIADNCQEEFIHIMKYLKLLHALCSDIGCEEEYVNTVLRIKQSFILYTLLDNEGAANVCQVMNEFFPKEDPLKAFEIKKETMKRRFLAVVKRQIYGFRKLIVKLLTDMEFRSYYFYDEWLEEFGSTFHSEMVSDINKYLMKIEGCLLSDTKKDDIYGRWFKNDSTNNPAMLYFLKLLMETSDSKVSEFELLRCLKWMFPGLDTSLLTMPSNGVLEVPEIFENSTFLKVFVSADWTRKEKKPWDYESLSQCLIEHSEKQTTIQNVAETEKNISKCKTSDTINGLKERTALCVIDQNQVHNRSHVKLRKRKRVDIEGAENQSFKRHCMIKTPVRSTQTKSLVVDLCKNNLFTKTPKGSTKLNLKSLGDTNIAIKLSVDSPQCRRLLESGSKFFSSGGRRKKSLPVVLFDVRTPMASETCNEVILFSDDEVNNGADSEELRVTVDTMGLTWIPMVRNSKSAVAPTSHTSQCKRTCRSLCFKSESSDEHVSESEPESSQSLQPMVTDYLMLLDQSIIPDLYTIHIKKTPQITPCSVQLRLLCEAIEFSGNGCMIISNCKIVNKDAEIIKNENTGFRFRNYGSN